MKKIVLTQSVAIALRTMKPGLRRIVWLWIQSLKHWDTSVSLRLDSVELEQPGVFMLRKSNDYRIFFTVQGNTVTVLDVAKKAALLASK